MIAMLQPVSPPPPSTSSPSNDGAGSGDLDRGTLDDGTSVDLKDALFSDPIVGVERVNVTEHGPGALEARPLTTPPAMTPAEKAKHDLTHLPFHPGCAICAATRRPNSMHLQSHEHLRVVPLLVADYCFMKFADDQCQQPILVMRLYPYKLFFLGCNSCKGRRPFNHPPDSEFCSRRWHHPLCLPLGQGSRYSFHD